MNKTIVLSLAVLILFGCAQEKRIKKEFALGQRRHMVETERSYTDLYQDKNKTLFYPMPPEQPRLQFLFSFTEENLAELKGGDTYFLQIKRSYDIGAVKGKIYISDRTYKKIIIIDLEKKQLSQITGDYEAAGIWVTENDDKYVADFNKKQIIVFNADNELTRAYAYRNQFDKPVDVAVYKKRIYVCDLDRHMIVVLDRDSGKTVQEIGGVGKDEGAFYKPTHVIVDKEGNLYVNDFFNFRIQKFDQDGNFVKSFGYPGDTLGAFARPKGLALDDEGHLYVVDAAFENVQIFDDETTDLLLFFGGFGLVPGSMYLPNGIYVDYHNGEYFKDYVDENFSLKYLVYVGNTIGPIRLNVYGFGEWTGETIVDKATQVLEE